MQVDPVASAHHPRASCWGAPEMILEGYPSLLFQSIFNAPGEGRHWMVPAYREHKGGHGRQELRMDHGEDGGQVALPGPHEEQSVDGRAGSQPHPRAT